MIGFVVRRRRRLLAAVAGLAVAAVTVSLLVPYTPALGLALLGLALVAAGPAFPDPEPADTLTVTGGTFATPRGARPVAAAASYVLLLAAAVTAGVHATDVRAPWLTLIAVYALPIPLFARGAWRGTGVTLTAAGVRHDRWSGSTFVPWDSAAAVDFPSRPFVTAAVAHYAAADPSRRADIGTAAGLPSPVRPSRRRRSARWVAGSAVSGLALAGAALALFAWTVTRLDGHGVLEQLPEPLVLVFFAGVGLTLHALTVNHRGGDDPPTPPGPPPRPSWSRDVTNG